MNAIEIPKQEWRSFLEGFVGEHRDWLVNLKLAERVGGDTADVQDMALSEIRLDEAPGGQAKMTFRTRDESGLRSAHTVAGVTRLRVLRREDGADAALSVESSDGAQLLMHFVSPQPAEAVDGVKGPPRGA